MDCGGQPAPLSRDVPMALPLWTVDAAGVEAEPLGRTGGKRLIFERPDRDDVVAIDDLRSAHEGFFPKLMGADAVLA